MRKATNALQKSEKQKHISKNMDKRNTHNLLTINYLLVIACRNYVVFILDYLPIQQVSRTDYQSVTKVEVQLKPNLNTLHKYRKILTISRLKISKPCKSK